MAHDVFISYSVKNKTTADAVCAVLESSGVRCWIAPRDVVPGLEWGECIIEAIEQSRIMVLVFTAEANASPQIRREVERAVNHGVAILPLRVEDVSPGRALEYFIGNVHWLDALTPPLEAHLKTLAGTTKVLLERLGPRQTLTPPATASGWTPAAAAVSKPPKREEPAAVEPPPSAATAEDSQEPAPATANAEAPRTTAASPARGGTAAASPPGPSSMPPPGAKTKPSPGAVASPGLGSANSERASSATRGPSPRLEQPPAGPSRGSSPRPEQRPGRRLGLRLGIGLAGVLVLAFINFELVHQRYEPASQPSPAEGSSATQTPPPVEAPPVATAVSSRAVAKRTASSGGAAAGIGGSRSPEAEKTQAGGVAAPPPATPPSAEPTAAPAGGSGGNPALSSAAASAVGAAQPQETATGEVARAPATTAATASEASSSPAAKPPPASASGASGSSGTAAAGSVVIPGYGFDPLVGVGHGFFAKKVTLRIGCDGEAAVEQGRLHFSNQCVTIHVAGHPLGPVSCDGLGFRTSPIAAVDPSGATVPDMAALKVYGRSGEALLYLSSKAVPRVETDLERICAAQRR